MFRIILFSACMALGGTAIAAGGDAFEEKLLPETQVNYCNPKIERC